MSKASAVLKILYDQEKAMLKRKFRMAAADERCSGPGRKKRWPVHCLACLVRLLAEPGGPAHEKALCQKTPASYKGRRGSAKKMPDRPSVIRSVLFAVVSVVPLTCILESSAHSFERPRKANQDVSVSIVDGTMSIRRPSCRTNRSLSRTCG